MIDAKCPHCGSTKKGCQGTRFFGSNTYTCKACHQKYKCIYPLGSSNLTEALAFGHILVITILAAYSGKLSAWLAFSICVYTFALAFIVLPKLRTWVPENKS